MSRGIALAVVLALAAPGAVRAAPEPAPAETPPPRGADRWRAELYLAGQPPQRQDYPCNVDNDCMSASQSFFALALGGRFERPERWSAALTLGLGHAIDFEERPAGGFGVASLRADVQVELGRGPGRFGAALRVSQVLLLGWSDTGQGLRSDIPGFALLVGERDLWGEIQIPVFPTHADPRMFYAGAGWRTAKFTLEGGVAQLGSLGYQHDVLDRSKSTLGLWLEGRLAVAGPWELAARLAVSYPFIAIVGVAYAP